MLGLLLAATPALPLDEAGKYVAGAYVVFLVLLVVYVAIMASETAADRAGAARAGQLRRAPRRRRRSRDASARRSAPMSELLALGVSHKTAPLDLRERLSLTEGRAVGALRELTEVAGIHEAAAISTCNRTELYLVVSDPVEAESTALGVLTRQAEIRPTELLGHLYSLRSGEAVRHLFRVTAGLDSMIVGEAEIQGQVKRAYELALVEGGDRADPQPPLPRRPRRRRPRPRRDRDQREGRLDPLGRGRAGAAHARRPRRAPRARDRRRRDRRAGRPGAGRAAASPPSSSPTATTTGRSAWPSASTATRSASRSCPSSSSEADIVVSATNSPHHIVERDDLEQVMANARGPAAAAGRHRRAARHRAGLPRDRRGQPARHRRRPADRRTQRRAAARPRRGGRSGSSTPSWTASSAGSPRSRWCRRSPRCASAATRSCAGSWPRTRAAGRASARPTASGWTRWRRRSPRGSCTSRPCG